MRRSIQVLARYLRLYRLFFSLYFRRVLEYRTDFFLGFGTHLARSGVGLLLVWALFSRLQVFHGWTFAEVLSIYGFSVLTVGITSFFSVSIFTLGRDIILSGRLDRHLLRPRNTLFLIMAEGINESALGQVLTGLVALGWALPQMPGLVTWANAAWFLVLLPSATLVYFCITLLSVVVCFWFEMEWGILETTEPLGAMAQYPLDIYTPGIRFLLTWVIPFGFTGFLPVAALLRPAEFGLFKAIIPIFSLLFFGLTYYLWTIGLRRYSSSGH
jgi:ABC-2 type transport system permease protein